MEISLIYRYPDLKERFLDAQDDDDLDDSLWQPKYLEIYAEAVKRWDQEKARGKK
jgi:hypothetical protein